MIHNSINNNSVNKDSIFTSSKDAPKESSITTLINDEEEYKRVLFSIISSLNNKLNLSEDKHIEKIEIQKEINEEISIKNYESYEDNITEEKLLNNTTNNDSFMDFYSSDSSSSSSTLSSFNTSSNLSTSTISSKNGIKKKAKLKTNERKKLNNDKICSQALWHD